GALRRERSALTVLERDRGLPAEHGACTRDVRLAHLRVVDGERLEDDLALRSGRLDHPLGELEERVLRRVADVHRQVLSALDEEVEAADQVVDIAEAARLRAV